MTSKDFICYDNFIRYFENYYISELSSHQIYDHRLDFLKRMKLLALQHQEEFELRHGAGAYRANLARYGALNRTPLQVVEGDLNTTHLLMPKISHNYATRYANRSGNFAANPGYHRWAAVGR